MANSLQIIDNFYDNADEVRAYALTKDFGVKGNYPGHRTAPDLNDGVRDYISSHIEPMNGKILWPDPHDIESYCGSFQYTTARDRTWIHADSGTTWAGVLYLTPDAPLSGGTGLFRHKATGLCTLPRFENGDIDEELLTKIYEDAQDMTKWEMTDRIANVYNRLVIYRGDYFHASLDYFGKDIYDGRLFQTFFFNTEKTKHGI